MSADQNSTLTPAYVPHTTFVNFVGKLKETGLPGRVDASLLSNYSGATQSQIMVALRFWGLTKEDGSVTDNFRALVKAHGEEGRWSAALKEYVVPCYNGVLGDLNLINATAGQLEDRFRLAGAKGSVQEKAIRLYLKLLDDTDTKYSPHFKKTRTASRTKPRKAAKKQPKKDQQDGAGSRTDDVAQDVIDFPIQLVGKKSGLVRLPANVSESDLVMIESMFTVIKTYVEQTSRKGE